MMICNAMFVMARCAVWNLIATHLAMPACGTIVLMCNSTVHLLSSLHSLWAVLQLCMKLLVQMSVTSSFKSKMMLLFSLEACLCRTLMCFTMVLSLISSLLPSKLLKVMMLQAQVSLSQQHKLMALTPVLPSPMFLEQRIWQLLLTKIPNRRLSVPHLEIVVILISLLAWMAQHLLSIPRLALK